jgi:hypothetical protein
MSVSLEIGAIGRKALDASGSAEGTPAAAAAALGAPEGPRDGRKEIVPQVGFDRRRPQEYPEMLTFS